MKTKEINHRLKYIADSARGHMSLNDLRNSILAISFLEFALTHIKQPSSISGFIIPYVGKYQSLRETSSRDHPRQIAQEILNLLCDVENQFEHLNGVFADLSIDRICIEYPDEFTQIFHAMDGVYGLTNEFRTGNDNYRNYYDHMIEFFSKREGKGQSELFTPTSIRSLFKSIIGEVGSILDPTCGSGSLLEPFINENTHRAIGQDINRQTLAIARLRFAFEPSVRLQTDDSLTSKLLFEVKTEAVVINPPFNLRFKPFRLDPSYYTRYGIPPQSNANMLWIQLAISHLKHQGTAMVILPNGSLSTSGREEKIRRALLEDGWIQSIINLPAGLFTYTSIPTTIWILSKNREVKDEILFVDLSKSAVQTDRNNIEISADSITKVSECYKSWKNGNGLIELSEYEAISIKYKDVEINEYNLNPSRYLPVEGINENDLKDAVELKELLSRHQPMPSSESRPEVIKKMSIKDLSKSVDQYEADIGRLEDETSERKHQIYHGDALIVANKGAKLKPTYLPKVDENIGFALTNVHAFRVDTTQIRMDYLIQELNKNYVNLQLSKYISGATIPFLKLSGFLKIKVSVPSLEQQEAAVKTEKEIRFQSLAELHGFEMEIKRIQEQQRKDLGSKKHNIMQHLNNVKSSSGVLHKFLINNGGILNSNDVINPKTGVTVLKRFERLNQSIENVLFYVNHLTNEIEFRKLEEFNAHELVKECVEKGVQSTKFEYTDNSDIRTFSQQKPIISVSKKDFEELYNNIIQNAIQHGFIDPDVKYDFRYSVQIANKRVEVTFENNGKPFPKGMGDRLAYSTRGEKAGETANSGEGGWKVSQIANHFGAELEIIDDPKTDFPVGVKLIFELIQ